MECFKIWKEIYVSVVMLLQELKERTRKNNNQNNFCFNIMERLRKESNSQMLIDALEDSHIYKNEKESERAIQNWW